jgi:hypothetical protein
MAAALATQNPNYAGLTGTQPIGQAQIAVRSEYAGTITSVRRTNTWTWAVVTRSARHAFRMPQLGASASIWFDRADGSGRYVVDYWGHDFAGQPIEAGRAGSLRAAIGIAVDSTARRWAEKYS